MTTDPTPTELDHDVREEWAARLQCADVGVDFPWLTEDGCDAWREQPVAAQEHYREMLRVALSAGLQIPPTAAVSAAAPNEREVRSALASVLCNAANYPAEVRAHILGRDLSRLVDAATAAVSAAAPDERETLERIAAALADSDALGCECCAVYDYDAVPDADNPRAMTLAKAVLSALAARPAPAVNAADLERELADAVVSIDAATERQMAEAASEDAAAEDMAAALDAANAETERLRAERFEAITALAWLAPNVTQDGRLSHAVRVVRDALTTAEAQRDEARAALAALRKWVGLLADDLERPDASTLAVKRVVAERLRAALAAAPSETEDVPTCPTPTDPKGTTR